MIYRYLAGAGLVLVALIGAFFYGVGVGKAREQAKAAVAFRHAIERLEQTRAAIDEASGRVAAIEINRQERVRQIYVEIPRIVRADPVYRNICINDDGVRLLDRARDAANGATAGPSSGGPGPSTGGAQNGGPANGQAQHER